MTPEINQNFINEYSSLITDNICEANGVDPQDPKAKAILAYNMLNPDKHIQEANNVTNKSTLTVVISNDNNAAYIAKIKVYESETKYKDYNIPNIGTKWVPTFPVTPGQKIVFYRFSPSIRWDYHSIDDSTEILGVSNAAYFMVPSSASGDAMLCIYSEMNSENFDYSDDSFTEGWVKDEACYPTLVLVSEAETDNSIKYNNITDKPTPTNRNTGFRVEAQVYQDLIDYFNKENITNMNLGIKQLLNQYIDGNNIVDNYREGEAWTALQIITDSPKRLYHDSKISYIYDSNKPLLEQDPIISGTLANSIEDVLKLYDNPITDLSAYSFMPYKAIPEDIIRIKFLRHGIDIGTLNIDDVRKYFEAALSNKNYMSVSPIVCKNLPLVSTVDGDYLGYKQLNDISKANTELNGEEVYKFSIEVTYVGSWWAFGTTPDDAISHIINNVNSDLDGSPDNWKGLNVKIGITNRVLTNDIPIRNRDNISEHERYCTFSIIDKTDPEQLLREVIDRMLATL